MMAQGSVYIAKSAQGFYKIGATISAPTEMRMAGLAQEAKAKVSIVRVFWPDHPRVIEAALHDIFAIRRVHGEWFMLETADVHWLYTVDDQCEKIMEWRRRYKSIFDKERENWANHRQSLKRKRLLRPAANLPVVSRYRIQETPTLDWDKYTLPMPSDNGRTIEQPQFETAPLKRAS